MAILVNSATQVVVQGATGKQGSYHILRMLEYNVRVVGGVAPGKGGQKVHDVPIYDTVSEAKRETSIDASMIIVPPSGVLDAALEAIENNIFLIVIITEFVPIHDTLIIRSMSAEKGICVVGPNTIGVISPGRGKVGIMPDSIYSEGNIGIIARSGTLTHEIASNLSYKGIGQSSCVCIGGDSVKGTDFVDVLELFRNDEQTKKIVLIGEIGGADEELAAEYLKNSYPKEIIAFVAGKCAPAEKKMGHAGAIISRGFGTFESKIKKLSEAGVIIARTLDEVSKYV